MAQKSYLIDQSILPMYMEASHEVVKEDGTVVTHRLVHGDSELDVKKQAANATPKIIFFGQRIYTTENKAEQQYIESSRWFATGRITEYDVVKINKEKLAGKKMSINLLKEVAAFDKKEIMQNGYVLFGRSAMDYIKSGDIDGLHDRIIEEAGNNPERVNEIISDKKNADTLYAGFLIASGVLEVSIDDRYVQWENNGGTVYTVPNGLTPLEGLVDYFQTNEGREVKKEAAARLEAKATKSKATSASANETDVTKMTLPKLHDYAEEKGYPEEEWKLLKKDELVKYITDKEQA